MTNQTNRFISDTTPWNLARDADPRSRILLNWVIYSSAEALRIAAIFLQPIMPSKAGELLDNLGVKPDRRTVEFAQKGKDLEYGHSSEATQEDRSAAKWASLFPPVPGVDLPDEEAMHEVETTRPLKSLTKNRMNRVSEYLAEEARAASKAGEKPMTTKEE